MRPLKRVEYDRMVDLGLFASERVELLYGALVQRTPQGGQHAYLLVQLNKLFVSALGDRADVRLQMPLAATEDSEPEPDLAIVPPGLREHPKSALLVIEVADSSRQKDRGLKTGLYAAAGIPEYWVIDLVEKVVEVRTDPERGRYKSLATVEQGKLSPKAFPDIQVDVGALLGRG
ncbi:MAG TPA: Uma2 family endonuclease [Myxococcales bacterium]